MACSCSSFAAIKSGWTRSNALDILLGKIIAKYEIPQTWYSTAETVITTESRLGVGPYALPAFLYASPFLRQHTIFAAD
jgi:hypothetical protein